MACSGWGRSLATAGTRALKVTMDGARRLVSSLGGEWEADRLIRSRNRRFTAILTVRTLFSMFLVRKLKFNPHSATSFVESRSLVMEDVWLCRRDYATARARLDDYVRGLRCGLNENLAHYFRNLESALRADSPFGGMPEVAHAIRNYVGDAVPPHIVGALVDRIWAQAVALQLNFLTTCMWKACSSLVSR